MAIEVRIRFFTLRKQHSFAYHVLSYIYSRGKKLKNFRNHLFSSLSRETNRTYRRAKLYFLKLAWNQRETQQCGSTGSKMGDRSKRVSTRVSPNADQTADPVGDERFPRWHTMCRLVLTTFTSLERSVPGSITGTDQLLRGGCLHGS